MAWSDHIAIDPVVDRAAIDRIDYLARCVGLDTTLDGSDAAGCSCDGDCTLERCPCIQANPFGLVFDRPGGAGTPARLLPIAHGIDYDVPVFECGPGCACRGRCANTATLDPVAIPPLMLRPAPDKGLGVFAAAPIPPGTFICEYTGELLRGDEAAERLKRYDAAGGGHALLVVREVLPSGGAALRTHIDATQRGNVARFFNHDCCGGNLEVVMVRSPGALLPRICFFAGSEGVEEGEELTFAYGPPNGDPESGAPPCRCGASACRGYLSKEDLWTC